jgi:hypothetical protein
MKIAATLSLSRLRIFCCIKSLHPPPPPQPTSLAHPSHPLAHSLALRASLGIPSLGSSLHNATPTRSFRRAEFESELRRRIAEANWGSDERVPINPETRALPRPPRGCDDVFEIPAGDCRAIDREAPTGGASTPA